MKNQSDRARWNDIYQTENAPRRVNERLAQYANLLKTGRVLDLAGGMGRNGAWLATYSIGFHPVVDADVSDEALALASPPVVCVLVDAGALPFAKHCFDTILNIRFFDPRVIFSEWLAEGGTVFFETFSSADAKYRPDFNPAHRFDLAAIPVLFRGLEILVNEETDDGSRVYITVVARK